jgi:hypothetical protein
LGEKKGDFGANRGPKMGIWGGYLGVSGFFRIFLGIRPGIKNKIFLGINKNETNNTRDEVESLCSLYE